MNEIELRIYEIDPDYRWNWLELVARDANLLGRYLSLRDDRTFVCFATGDLSLDGAPSEVKKLTVRKLAPATPTALDDLRRTAESPVLEIRRYRIAPGQRDRFKAFYNEKTTGPQAQHGISLYSQFDDLDDENHYIWLRGFPDAVERDRRKASFYQSDTWLRELQDEAFSMIEDYSDVLLVSPVP
jgi:quinol monooxygenase YgiN